MLEIDTLEVGSLEVDALEVGVLEVGVLIEAVLSSDCVSENPIGPVCEAVAVDAADSAEDSLRTTSVT